MGRAGRRLEGPSEATTFPSAILSDDHRAQPRNVAEPFQAPTGLRAGPRLRERFFPLVLRSREGKGRAGRRLDGPSGATTLPLPVILSDGHTGALHLATPRGDLGWGRRPRAGLAAVASDLAPTVRAVAAATRLWREPVEASTRAVPALPPFSLVLRSREGWGCWMAASRGRARLRTGRAGRQHGISRRGEAPTTAGTCWPDDKRSLGAVRSALWVPRPGAMSPFCSRAPSRPLPHVILSPTISRIRCPPNRLASIPAARSKREESRRLAVSTPS